MVKHKYIGKMKEQFSRCMWQGFLTIMDYKNKASHITFNNATLPDKLNTLFSRFERNDPELLRRAPDENVGYTLTVSTEDRCKSFKHVNPRKAAGPDDILSLDLRARARPAGCCVLRHF